MKKNKMETQWTTVASVAYNLTQCQSPVSPKSAPLATSTLARRSFNCEAIAESTQVMLDETLMAPEVSVNQNFPLPLLEGSQLVLLL